MKDIQFSYKFAQTHLNVGMPSMMRTHAHRHRTDIDRIRQTDTDAASLTNFRDSIRNNSTDPRKKSGTDDYTRMVDIIIRRGGLLDHYAGPDDIRDWAKAKDLKGQFKDLMESVKERELLGEDGIRASASALLDNKALQGALSVARTAAHSAVSEVQSAIGEEVTPEVLDEILTAIVGELNGASVEAFGQPITLDDFKNYLSEVGDGLTQPTEFKI